MRLVVAVGGNALLERGEVPLAEIQETHVRVAVDALAPLAAHHDLVITHGNGPQVGLLANESALDPALPGPYPLDVLGAQTQGMIGYFFLQAFENALPNRRIVSLIGQTQVRADDPAFGLPTKFVGPGYTAVEGHKLARERGWHIRPDGAAWRRVVASPEPVAIVELPTIRMLVDAGALVICAGGGGIPVIRGSDGRLRGTDAVIDKDLSAALLARQLEADALLILTDVANVETGFGTPSAHPIGSTTPEKLRAGKFPAGSMGPKIEAACRFVETTGKPAMIGSLDEAGDLLRGTRGTIIKPATESDRRSAGTTTTGQVACSMQPLLTDPRNACPIRPRPWDPTTSMAAPSAAPTTSSAAEDPSNRWIVASTPCSPAWAAALLSREWPVLCAFDPPPGGTSGVMTSSRQVHACTSNRRRPLRCASMIAHASARSLYFEPSRPTTIVSSVACSISTSFTGSSERRRRWR
jgi:carbamate kinase